jgi:dTDP-4-dehydrorhamnose reductase
MKSTPKKLLITGASGFLGYQLCKKALDGWQVYGIFHSTSAKMPGVSWIQADIGNYRSLKALMESVRPQAVIHAAAITQPNFCQEHRQISTRINVEACLSIAGLAADARIPLVFTSTDLVFDGTSPPYAETDPPAPTSVYGEQKALAESEMQRRYPHMAICRLPLMFGIAGGDKQGFTLAMIRALARGEAVKLFVDEYRTPVDTASAAGGILQCLEGFQGLTHLGGTTRISRYTMGCLVEQLLGKQLSSIVPLRLADLPMAAPRPPDVSLDSSQAFGRGYRPQEIKAALANILEAIGYPLSAAGV